MRLVYGTGIKLYETDLHPVYNDSVTTIGGGGYTYRNVF